MPSNINEMYNLIIKQISKLGESVITIRCKPNTSDNPFLLVGKRWGKNLLFHAIHVRKFTDPNETAVLSNCM